MARFDYRNSSDRELLVQFEQVRDQSAFSELVLRHGPMVMATCIRTLGRGQDAEDAFQATFFALAKGVQRIRNKDAIAGWLHQTAKRTSSSIWRGLVKNQTEPMDSDAVLAADETATSPMSTVVSREILEVLDEEIQRLPAKLRAIVVCCHLEGLSLSEAAKRLGISPSSAHERLAKSRARLKARLLNRGVTITLAGVTTAVLAATRESAAMVVDSAASVSHRATACATGKLVPGSDVTAAALEAAEKEVASLVLSNLIWSLSAVALLLLATWLTGYLGYSTVQALTAAPEEFAIVAPLGMESVEGDMSVPNDAQTTFRFQERWAASYFNDLPNGGAWLVGFADRLDGTASSETTLTQNVSVFVSTSPRKDIGLDFEANVGDDVVEVLRGEVTRSYPISESGANTFGTPYVFDTPFFYDPSQGDLLLEIQLKGGRGSGVVYDSQSVGASIGALGRIGAPRATGFINDHVVSKFYFDRKDPTSLESKASEIER